MKNFNKLIVVLLIVSAAQIQKVSAQSECENTAEVERSVLIAYNTSSELMYHTTLRTGNTYNTNTSLASTEEQNSSESKFIVVDELIDEQQTLLESNLRELDEALTVDSEENLQVENWMLTPDNWIVSR